jgi:hypothetical protein
VNEDGEVEEANMRNEGAKVVAIRVDTRQVPAWGLGHVFEE